MLNQVGESFQILAKHTLTYLGDLKSHKIRINAEQFAYLEGGKGPVLLLLHGAAGSKTQWRTVMQQLAQHYRIIAVDLPGFSLQQLGHPAYRTIRDMVGWLQRFVEGLQLNTFHIMAACSGAIVAASYALQQPDRVRSLTAVGLPDLQSRARLLEVMTQLVINNTDDVETMLTRIFYRPPALPNVVKRFYVQQTKNIQHDFDSRVEELLNALPQLIPRLRSLSFPVLLVSGEEDVFSTPMALEKMSDYFGRQAKIALIPLCGHLPFLEKPEIVVKHFLDFQRDVEIFDAESTNQKSFVE